MQRHYCTVFKFLADVPHSRHAAKRGACSGDAQVCLKRRVPEIARETAVAGATLNPGSTRRRQPGRPARTARECLPGRFGSIVMGHAIRQRNPPPQYRRIPAFRSRPMSGWDGVAAGLLAAGLTLFGGCFGAAAQDRPGPVSACTGRMLRAGLSAASLTAAPSLSTMAAKSVLPRSKCRRLRPPGDAKGGALVAMRQGQALAGLLAGGDIVLKQADAQTTDRYGRLVGYRLE